MRLPPILDRLVVRLVVVAVVSGVVAALIGGALVAGLARSALRGEIAERNMAVAQDLAVRFDTRVDSIAASLRLATVHPSVQAMEASSVTSLRAFLATSVTLEELVLFDDSGIAVAAAADRFFAEVADYPDRPDLVEAARDPTVNVVGSFPPVLEVATPVEFPPGSVRGMLVARAPLELVAGHIQQRDSTSTAEQFLTGPEGHILVHPSRDLMADRQRFTFPSFFEGNATHGISERNDTRWLVAVAPTELLDGAVVVRQEEASALSPVVAQLRQLSLIVAAVIGVTVVAISLAGRRLLRPLRSLSQAVEEFGRGDFGARAEAAGGEIGAVAHRFNQMAAHLDRRRAEVDELHGLSLLVTSRADRQEVAQDVVQGIRRLLAADAAILLTGDEHDRLAPLASIGGDGDRLAIRLATRARASGESLLEVGDHGRVLVALPVEGADAQTSGVLVVTRGQGPPDEEETRLAETFASFAGVALASVRRLELEQRLVYELQKSLDQRRELLGNITHDLRAPVVSILNLSSRFRRKPSEGEAASDLLAHIEREAVTLDSLVSTLLEFTIAERGPHGVTMAPLRLHSPLDSAIDLLGPQLGDRPLRIEVSDTEVIADSILMKRVFVHLLSNAVRFSPPGTPIEVRSRREKGEVIVEVVDHGFGLTTEEAARAFEPFWRSVSSNHLSSAGLGLGLSLAADYVRAMGGYLGVDSQPGRGSIFYVSLITAERSGGGPPPDTYVDRS